MAKLTSAELLVKQAEYLTREIAQHERDIITNQGKVQENKELLERVQNTCLYCADYIWAYSDEDRMESHIKSRHAEERKEERESELIPN